MLYSASARSAALLRTISFGSFSGSPDQSFIITMVVGSAKITWMSGNQLAKSLKTVVDCRLRESWVAIRESYKGKALTSY